MWEILENYLLIKALNTCPKSNKSPNLVTLIADDIIGRCQTDDILKYFHIHIFP